MDIDAIIRQILQTYPTKTAPDATILQIEASNVKITLQLQQPAVTAPRDTETNI